MFYKDYIRVLNINLSTGRIRVDKRKDLRAYLGGVGVASKLLQENMNPDLPPLHEDQPIIFAIGAASSVFPVITKTVAMFVSPLTGELGESYAGGRLAFTMLHAGYDAIVITGKSQKPCYVTVTQTGVEIKDARAFWGMDSDKVGSYIRNREHGSGKRSIIRIGPAGENLCSYASVCVDTYRHFGRLGLGAVFGSKLMKAMQVTGDLPMPIPNFKDYFKTYSKLYKQVTETEVMAKYHDAGTPINVEPLSAMGGLPTRNLTSGTFEHAENISGEAFAKNNLIRKMACTGCPVGCIHIGQFRREFDHGYEYEAISVGYDYELIYALGSFLGVDNTDGVLYVIDAVERNGLDAMSCGVVLGWACEALERGIITEEQTILPLKMGDYVNLAKAVDYIAQGVNQLYTDMGKGVKYVAKKYGGYDFGMQIAGNEMPGYHTGYGSLVGALVGARHSHLCNAGYSYDQSNRDKELDKEKLVDYLISEEIERCLLNSLIICLFARKVYSRENIRMVLKCVGLDYTDETLTDIAKRILRTKLEIKKSLGFAIQDVKLPKRFFETPTTTGKLDQYMANEIAEEYARRCEEILAEEDESIKEFV
ncbi:MAG TPA: aldehyde ferredoxin oxidoreductase C-terminal domain-containing protein [Clostridia bacterium]|jgi:aldehyde:ferredoxin oxidoreductase|nr:aldehyde ferredoxin oxidoreductase C-terminal domain-containing protein [Clostridia bacterium]